MNNILLELGITKEEILKDLYTCIESRVVSTLGAKEVFLGKAAFGIFGSGKELPQVVMARFFQKGDFRSGYYRDQTFMFAIGAMNARQIFSQLYAHTDVKHEIVSAGRLMTGHFGTKSLNDDGSWKRLSDQYNSATDISPTAAQMPRLVGMGLASKLFKQNPDLHKYTEFSHQGREVSWGTIGNASCAEGMFYESINAAGVLQIPIITSIWDDDYGISVHNDLQTTKGDISAVLEGFRRNEHQKGIEIFKVRGWNYLELLETYAKADKIAREEHVPVVIHVVELTQPHGHSTSGSHERYKTKERLDWEKEFDCNTQFINWCIQNQIVTQEDVDQLTQKANDSTVQARKIAWDNYLQSLREDSDEGKNIIHELADSSQHTSELEELIKKYEAIEYPLRRDLVTITKQAIRLTRFEKQLPARQRLVNWNERQRKMNRLRYSASLFNHHKDSVLNVKGIQAEYSDNSQELYGFEILQRFFDKALENNPLVFAFGEDVGKIGDVNQGMAGLQDKFGDLRVTDTGIRECTILGQAIGAALRGLRPIAEIQYVDYLLYAIQIISDDLATTHHRSAGQQKCPVIIRTRGHRLQGVWHSGSPLGTVLNAMSGIHVCVPRNMLQAAGMYNALLKSGDPGLVIETLNAYRLKEKLPDNIGDYTVRLGEVEILKEGTDITIITYGAMCRVVLQGVEALERIGISCEVIDVQTLIPFDRDNVILESIKKTNRILIADEDIPGGSSAYMLQKILENEEAYHHLDSKPRTLHSWAHRPAYAQDGDYFSKPNSDDVFDWVYEMMHESDPKKFPSLYK